MKLSVSLSEADVRLIDAYAAGHGDLTRSAVVRRAVRGLRLTALEAEYAAAIEEWDGSQDATLWDSVSADGLGDAAR